MFFPTIKSNHTELLTRAWNIFVPKSIFWQIKVRCVRHKNTEAKLVCICWQLQLSTFFCVSNPFLPYFQQCPSGSVLFLWLYNHSQTEMKPNSISQSSRQSSRTPALINLLNSFLNLLILLISTVSCCKGHNYNTTEFPAWGFESPFCFLHHPLSMQTLCKTTALK